MLSAHGNDDLVQMATPRVVRPCGSDELKAAANAKGIFMIESSSTPGGLSEKEALNMIGKIPAPKPL